MVLSILCFHSCYLPLYEFLPSFLQPELLSATPTPVTDISHLHGLASFPV